jgi:hypothetical protein
VPIVALVNLLFGIGFALIARDRLKADGPFATPAFPLVMLHAGAIVAPIALYFYAAHPAWAWLYWIDPDKLTSLALVPLMVGHAALVFGGWYLGAVLIRHGAQGALFYVAGAVVLVIVIMLVACSGRLSTATDYLGYVKGVGLGLFEVKLGWAFLVSLGALFGSGIYVAIELGRDARRVRAR